MTSVTRQLAGQPEGRCEEAEAVPAGENGLSTQQKNALRKIFDRQEFTPEEVAQLGYRRLQQAEGIGRKGLQSIADWLQRFGLELTPPEVLPPANGASSKKLRRSVEQAMRLLRTHGYDVVPCRSDEKHDF